MSDMTVPNTIFQQLGGRRFSTMTGAKNFVGSDNSLTFKLPASLTGGITHARITLNDRDLYDMEFIRATVRGIKTISQSEDVYFDSLQDVFTRHTGMRTSL